MLLKFFSEIPDEDIPEIVEAIRIVSDNPYYHELKKVDSSDPQSFIMAYMAKNLHNIFLEYKKVKGEI